MGQTFFTNDRGSGSAAGSYIQDAFPDVTLKPTNNTGLTDTANTNPLGDYFADADGFRFKKKELFIKDIVLEQDRSKWINQKPTFRIIWHETFPGISGYCFGNLDYQTSTSRLSVTFQTPGDGIGITGKVRRVSFIVRGDTPATGTAQVKVDGSNGSTLTFGNLTSAAQSLSFPLFSNRYFAIPHAAANETNDLHDIRCVANEAATLHVIGVVVYFENAGANLEVGTGTSYVNKTRFQSTTSATFAIPTFGSSLGGVASVYKSGAGAYSLSAQSLTTMISIAAGASGSALLTVSNGTGASFPAGSGIGLASGTSQYFGIVQSVSTDTLTMSPALPFGMSNTSCYRAFLAGTSYPISSTFMKIADSITFSDNQTSLTLPIFSKDYKWALWGNNLGVTFFGTQKTPGLYFKGASGALYVEGNFNAANMEINADGVGGIFGATVCVGGFPAWSMQEGVTSIVQKTIFSEAGSGWNRFSIQPSASMGILAINRINLYDTKTDPGISFGMIAKIDFLNTYTNTGYVNATMSCLGINRRVFSDQIYFTGGDSLGTRIIDSLAAGGIKYAGFSTMVFHYYGKDFGIIGTAGGGTLLLDGNPLSLTFNTMQSVATEGFHTVQYIVAGGGTALISAIDYVSSSLDPVCYQNVLGALSADSLVDQVQVGGTVAYGTSATKVVTYSDVLKRIGNAVLYNGSPTNGDSFTIFKKGLYAVCLNGSSDIGGAVPFGVTRNQKEALSTSITAIPNSRILLMFTAQAGIPNNGAWVGMLYPGDVLRVVANANTLDANFLQQFTITLIKEVI